MSDSSRDAALQLFESISSVRHVDGMISDGEAEGLHLECKAPVSPRLSRDQRVSLARAVSGFANTTGGVILWGVSTTRHQHSGLDVLTQVELIGDVKQFERQVKDAIPGLTTPTLLGSRSRILLRKSAETRGLVVTYVPPTAGDPYQSALDDKFYFRSGSEFVVAPYELVKRLFAATESPDLIPIFETRLAERGADDVWRIPVSVANLSNAAAEHCKVSLGFGGATACESLECPEFIDASAVNPDERFFWGEPEGVVHRGINFVLGYIHVKMKVGKRSRRRLDLTIRLFANKMRAKEVHIALKLTRSGLESRVVSEGYVY